MRTLAVLAAMVADVAPAAGSVAAPRAVAAAPAAGSADGAPAAGRVGAPITPAGSGAPPPVRRSAPAAAVPMLQLTFDEAIRRGLSHNAQAQVAARELSRAAGILASVRGPSLPSLRGLASYTRLDHDRLSGGHLVAGRDQDAASINATVPLVAPTSWGAWAQARTGLEVSQSAQLATNRVVALAVARAYLAAISQERLFEVIQHAVDTAQAHYDFAHDRYRGGVGNHLDELLAGQELAGSQVQRANARDGVSRTREALGVILGEDVPCRVETLLTLPDVPVPAAVAGHGPGDEFDDDDLAATGRQDVVLSYARVVAARQVEHDAFLDYLPSLVANGNAFFQQPPSITTPILGWQVQLLLTVPFWDGGSREGLHLQARAGREAAEVQLADNLRQARSEVRVAFSAVAHADEALAAAQDAVARAQESIQLAAEAYRAGNTTNLVVVDAERRGRDADTAAIVAEDAVRQARLDLLTAAGKFP